MTSFALNTTAIFAENNTQNLKQINHKIESVKITLDQAQTLRDALQKKLSDTELLATSIRKKISATEESAKKESIKMHYLQKNLQANADKMHTEESVLQHQLTAAYVLSRQSYLKLFFTQHDTQLTRF